MRRIVVIPVLLLVASMAFGQVAPSSSGSLYDRIIKVEAPGGVTLLNLEGQVHRTGLFDDKTILGAVSWNAEAQAQFKKAFGDQTVARVIGLVGAAISLAGLGIRIYTATQPLNSHDATTLAWWSGGLSLASIAAIFVATPYAQKGDEEMHAAINRYNADVLAGK